MLQKTLLGLCLVPLLAHAEITCLEGPSGDGKCHTVDVHGEVFKTADVSTETVKQPNTATTNKNSRINLVIRPNQQKNIATTTQTTNNSRPMTMTEQRIRQRAQTVETRFMRRQGARNISALNDNDSLVKRKQDSAKLRHRIETQ